MVNIDKALQNYLRGSATAPEKDRLLDECLRDINNLLTRCKHGRREMS